MHLNNTQEQNATTARLSNLLGNLLTDNSEIKEESVTIEQADFQKIRQILCAVLGVLTRLSFLCSFGKEYVQVSRSVRLGFWLIWFINQRAYIIILCPSLLGSLSVSVLASVSLSVYSPPSNMARHRNFIFGVNMYTCP